MAEAVLASGLAESFMQVVPVAASLVVVLMLVAMGTYAYKQLRGDGVEWPDDKPDEPAEDELRRGSDDDEWKYY